MGRRGDKLRSQRQVPWSLTGGHNDAHKELTAWFRGDEPAARAAFNSARKELEQTVRNQPNYAAALCALGVLDAAVGNKQDAIREGLRAVELMPVSKSAIEGAMLIEYLAVIYGWTGDKDHAIERLAEATKLPGGSLLSLIHI